MSSIFDAKIIEEPFPHMVVPDVVNNDFYKQMLAIMPTEEAWKDVAGIGQPNLALRWGSASSFPTSVVMDWAKFSDVFLALDLALLNKFRPYLEIYLRALYTAKLTKGDEVTFEQLQLGSAVLCERTPSWWIEPHLHDLTQVVQSMLYMPYSGTEGIQNGTILYRLKRSRKIPSRMLFKEEDPRNGARRAALTFEEDELEEAARLPYQPNTLVAWINTPQAIHASPVTKDRRRYALSCCVMPDGLGSNKLSEVDLMEWDLEPEIKAEEAPAK